MSRHVATIWHFGTPVPGKNNPQLWIDKKRCLFLQKEPRPGDPLWVQSITSKCQKAGFKTNALCKGMARLTMNKRVKKYMASLNAQARICQAGRKPTEKLVRMDGTLYVGDVVRRDVLGMLESIADALEKVVYDDDFQIHELHIYRRLDRKLPRMEFEFSEVEDTEFDEALEKARQNRTKGQDRKKRKESSGQVEMVMVP